MSVECYYGCNPKEYEGHDRGDALELGVVDCASVFGLGQAVQIRYGDRWSLVEEGLPEAVWDLGGYARLGQGSGPP